MPGLNMPQPVKYQLAKDAGLLDKAFTQKTDATLMRALVRDGGDTILANADVVNLKGVGPALARHLGSRKFNIRTVGEFAHFMGGFNHPLQELKPGQQKTLAALRDALEIAKGPWIFGPPGGPGDTRPGAHEPRPL